MTQSTIVGLHVKLNRGIDRVMPCPCGDDIAVIGPGKGPHAAALRCATCKSFRGWLSDAAAAFLEKVARAFRTARDPTDPTKVLEVIQVDTSQFTKQRYMAAKRLSAPVVATIDGFEVHEMRNGSEKPVLTFEHGQPPLILNQDNLYALQDSMGFDSDGWIGARVELSPGTFTTQDGEMKPLINLRVVERPPVEVQPPQQQAQQEPVAAPAEAKRKARRGDLDEPVPF
jgi:hypothetical protein